MFDSNTMTECDGSAWHVVGSQFHSNTTSITLDTFYDLYVHVCLWLDEN